MNDITPATSKTAQPYGTVVAATAACLVLLGISTAGVDAMKAGQLHAQNVPTLVTKQEPAAPKKKPQPKVAQAPAAPIMSYEEMYQLMLREQQEEDRKYFESINGPATQPAPPEAPAVTQPAQASLASAPVGQPAPAPAPTYTPAPVPAAQHDHDDGGDEKRKGGKKDD